jgi:hypothetical protein
MVASFAELLFKVRNTFIVAGVPEEDVHSENNFSWNMPRHDSEPWLMSSSLRWDRDIKVKSSDSDAEHGYSDSTHAGQTDNPDWDPGSDSSDSMSCFEDIDMVRQLTEECWPDDTEWQPDVKKACSAKSVEASSDPDTNIEQSETDEKHSVVEVVESSSVASVEKEVSEDASLEPCSIVESPLFVEKCSDPEVVASSATSDVARRSSTERVRWADVVDENDPAYGSRASETSEVAKKGHVKTKPLLTSCTSQEEGSDGGAETKMKRQHRRKSLIDKAVQEQQQYPRRSKLRSSAPVFVPMALEVDRQACSDLGKKLCSKCGAAGEQHFKFCNFCGTSFSKLPLGFMNTVIQ